MRPALTFGPAAIATTIALLVTAIGAAGTIVTAHPPVHVSMADDNRFMGELLVAADPFDAARLLACGMVYSNEENRMWVSAYRTVDQGRTWTRVFETRENDGVNDGDPACAFGRDGRVYVSVISLPPFGDFTQEVYLKLFRSLDSGATWSQSVSLPVSFLGFDREYLAVDNTGGPQDGTIYMNATAVVRSQYQAPSQSGVGLWISRDHGVTFEPPMLRTPPAGQISHPSANGVVLSDGTFVSLYGDRIARRPSAQSAPGARVTAGADPAARLRLAIAPPGGRSFEAGRPIADFYLSSVIARGAQIPSLAVDPGTTAFKDRLYVAWADSRSGRSEILLTYSDDKGLTWSTPIFVNDDHGIDRPFGSGDHTLPVVAVNRNGIVGVMWYDRRSVDGPMGWDIRFAASLDGGDTFLPSADVSGETSRFDKDLRFRAYGFVDSRMDRRQGQELQVHIEGRQFFAGDTAGMAADAAGVFHPVWIDLRTRTPQLWSASVKVAANAVRNGSASLARLKDVSTSVVLDVQSASYDEGTGEVSATVVLRNTSANALLLPLTVRLLRVSSVVGERIVALNTDNQQAGPDAVWEFGRGGLARLEPQQSTAPRTLRFRLDGLRPYKSPDFYRHELVRMRARILAPPQ